MKSFEELKSKFGISEFYFKREFKGLPQVDFKLAKSKKFFTNLIGWEYVKFYKQCGLELIDLKVDEVPPPGVSHHEWMKALSMLWDLYD